MVRMRIAALVVLALVLVPGSVKAGPEQDKLLAKQHFESGSLHFDLSEYDQALLEFKEAYRLKPDATFLYNIAQCHRKLGHIEEALTFYRTYLRRSPKAPNREEVERRIEELDAEQRAKQDRALADAQAASAAGALGSAISPAPVPTPVPMPLPAAPEAAANPGSREGVEVVLPAPAAPPREATAETSILHRWWFWSAAGAVVVTGVVVGILVARGGGGTFCSDCADTSGVNIR
jgi:hypothetical protein